MDLLIYPAITVLYLILALFAFRLFRESSLWGSAWTLFIILALLFDSTVLSIGNVLGPGSVLEVLSQIRYLLYVILFPTLIFVSLDQLRKIHIDWIEQYRIRISFHAYTAIVTLIGILVHYQWVLVVPVEVNGLLRYQPAEEVFPWVSLLAMLSIFVTGLIYWKKVQWSVMLLGAGISMMGVLMSYVWGLDSLLSLSELIMMCSIVLTDYRNKATDYEEVLYI